MMRVPFNRPSFPSRALVHMQRAVSNEHLAGDGEFTKKCEAWIESRLKVSRCLLTTSGTAALELAMLLLDVGPGDEVIVPSFTFVSCANAVVLRGATPVFADIEEPSLSVTPSTVEPLISERTKAVMSVHYGGVGRFAQQLREMCDRRGVAYLEDAAHSFLGADNDQPLGGIGQLGAFSFHETKNFSMGEGGALVTTEEEFGNRAEILREKGTNRKQFFKGLVDKYTWVDVGSSFVPSDLLAALLWAQLEVADEIVAQRRWAWWRYFDGLSATLATVGAQVCSDGGRGATHHTFFVLLPDGSARDRTLRELRERGVNAVFHYLPLEDSPFGQRFGGSACRVSASVASRLIRLPLFPNISAEEIDFVIEQVQDVIVRGRCK